MTNRPSASMDEFRTTTRPSLTLDTSMLGPAQGQSPDSHVQFRSTIKDAEKSPALDDIVAEGKKKSVSDEAETLTLACGEVGAITNNKYGDDPFGNEEGNDIQYKTLTWWYVAKWIS